MIRFGRFGCWGRWCFSFRVRPVREGVGRGILCWCCSSCLPCCMRLWTCGEGMGSCRLCSVRIGHIAICIAFLRSFRFFWVCFLAWNLLHGLVVWVVVVGIDVVRGCLVALWLVVVVFATPSSLRCSGPVYFGLSPWSGVWHLCCLGLVVLCGWILRWWGWISVVVVAVGLLGIGGSLPLVWVRRGLDCLHHLWIWGVWMFRLVCVGCWWGRSFELWPFRSFC